MGFIPDTYGQSVTVFSLIGTQVYGAVVLGHSFGVGVPNPVDGANAVFDSWEAADVATIMPDTWQLDHVDISINDGGGINSGTSTRTAVPGNLSGDGAAPNLAVLVRKTTNQSGRQGRGRMYFPACDEASINASGQLDGAYVTLCQGVMTALINDMDGNEVPLRLLHAAPGGTPAIILALSVQALAATQRRRLRR